MGAVGVVSLVAGLSAVIGGFLTLALGLSRERMDELLALGTGFLLGGSLFSMVPEATHASATSHLYVALGYLGTFLFRQLLSAGGHHAGASSQGATAAVLGVLLHSLFDGAALGVTWSVNPGLGLTVLLAMCLHKLPEGFGTSAMVLSATGSARLAMGAAGAIGAATVLGAWAPLLWAGVGSVSHDSLLGLAAGSFLYVSSSEMLPSVTLRGRQAAWLVLVGATLVFILTRYASFAHVH